MKLFFFICIAIFFTSFNARTQTISLSINSKKLTVFDTTAYEKHFAYAKKNWRSQVVDSIDTDKEPILAVRFMKNDADSMPVTVIISYVGRGYNGDRLYGTDSISINKNDSFYVFREQTYFDLLIFDLQYGKQKFRSAVKFYSGEYQKKLNKTLPLQIYHLHFLNDTINTNPCLDFKLYSDIYAREDSYVFKEDDKYYILLDSVQLYAITKITKASCYSNFPYLEGYFPYKIATQDIKNQHVFVEGEIKAPNNFYKRYKKQIKNLPKVWNKKLLSEKPYLYIADIFSEREYRRKAGFWEYIMQIGDTDVKILFFCSRGFRLYYLQIAYSETSE